MTSCVARASRLSAVPPRRPLTKARAVAYAVQSAEGSLDLTETDSSTSLLFRGPRSRLAMRSQKGLDPVAQPAGRRLATSRTGPDVGHSWAPINARDKLPIVGLQPRRTSGPRSARALALRLPDDAPEAGWHARC